MELKLACLCSNLMLTLRVLIVPFMELKPPNVMDRLPRGKSLNRTFYGIETT